jgi:hypothetical protein
VQKQDNVTDKWVGHFAAQKNFEVTPQHLRREPGSKTRSHQKPEEPCPALPCGGIRQNGESAQQ